MEIAFSASRSGEPSPLPAASESLLLKGKLQNGVSLTHDESSASYVIIRHNVRTYQSAGVVEVVKGRQNAETALKKFRECQSAPDYHEGWRYFFEKTDLKAGMDPAHATDLRQADLESRESKYGKE